MGIINNLIGQANPMQMLQQLKSNPAAFLSEKGVNIPHGMNDPQQIINHLLQTGQVNQQQVNNAYQMMGRFR